MAEEKIIEKESVEKAEEKTREQSIAEAWEPLTALGKRVKDGSIKLDEIMGNGLRILEPVIVDVLLPNMESTIIEIGQSKGKFGGGKRSIWKQTQKKTAEGNKPKFATMVVIGNRDGYVGLGYGKAKETVPAKGKALIKAKLNLISVKRSCGSWECGCSGNHSIPIAVTGKCGSVKVTLMPAPKGTGLCVAESCKGILELAGIKDVYSKTVGQTRSRVNMACAFFDALKRLNTVK